MGFFLWGVMLGWLMCTLYHYSQNEDSKATSGAFVILFMILIAAAVISISLGAPNAPNVDATSTPTSLGR